MKFRPYTFMIIPQNARRIFKLKIPFNLVVSIVLIFFVLVGFGSYIIYDYFYVISKLQDIDNIKARNRKLGKQLYSYKIRIEEIEDTIERIRALTTKLKIISNLSDPERYSHMDISSDYEILEGIDDLAMSSDVEIDNQFRNIQIKLREIEHKISFQEEELTKFSEYLAEQSSLLASTPSMIPVKGWITSGFGPRIDPFIRRIKHHDGLDVATRIGTPILAPADGIVIFAGSKPGYGLTLVIDHGYGISTRYCHNSRFYVSQGTKVKRGMPIASVGNTGRSTGPHLHYEVQINGIPVDPRKFILDNPWE